MRFLLLVASMLLISACGKTPAPGPSPEPTAPPVEQAEKHTTVIDPQIKAYNDARQVQGKMDAAQVKRQDEMSADGL